MQHMPQARLQTQFHNQICTLAIAAGSLFTCKTERECVGGAYLYGVNLPVANPFPPTQLCKLSMQGIAAAATHHDST